MQSIRERRQTSTTLGSHTFADMPVVKDTFPKGYRYFDPTKTIASKANNLPGKTFPGPSVSKDFVKKLHEKAKGLAQRAGIQSEMRKQEMHNQYLGEISRLRGHAVPIQNGMVETRIRHLRDALRK
jgi:hypothetical protein